MDVFTIALFLVGVGLLVLAGLLYLRRHSQRQSYDTIRCSACGERFATRQNATEHCYAVHNAPDQDAVNWLLEWGSYT